MASKNPYEGPTSGIGAQQSQAGAGDENAAQGTLSQFEGPVQQSPFYKTLLNTGLQSTTNAYNNATSKAKQQALQAGEQGQPSELGAEGGIQSQEAGALANVPIQAEEGAAQAGLAAAGQTANLGENQVGQGLSGYKAASDINNQNYQRQQNLWKTIAGVFDPLTNL